MTLRELLAHFDTLSWSEQEALQVVIISTGWAPVESVGIEYKDGGPQGTVFIYGEG